MIDTIDKILLTCYTMKGQTKKELEKMRQGTMRSEGKRPRTTSVIDPPLHNSLLHEWLWVLLVVVTAPGRRASRRTSRWPQPGFDLPLNCHHRFWTQWLCAIASLCRDADDGRNVVSNAASERTINPHSSLTCLVLSRNSSETVGLIN